MHEVSDVCAAVSDKCLAMPMTIITICPPSSLSLNDCVGRYNLVCADCKKIITTLKHIESWGGNSTYVVTKESRKDLP